MTVQSSEPSDATLLNVAENATVTNTLRFRSLNADLTIGADVSATSRIPLRASGGLAHDGVKLHGSGFIIEPSEAVSLSDEAGVIRPYVNGRDLAQRPRNKFVIDFALLDEESARRYPRAFDIVRTRVKPQRDANKRGTYRRYWWRFGEPRRDLRSAIAGLEAFVVTVDTARHRYFTLVTASTVVDDKLVAIASDDFAFVGMLSSWIHVTWATAAGGRLGVGDDPVYSKTTCFDPFPFPILTTDIRDRISALAERLDSHRKSAIARDERVTMTGMYNVVEKLRSGEPLTVKERAIHEIAACGVLRDMHDELDQLVAEAYGWPWPMQKEEILERLVALHDERVEEEKRGLVRWLRPEYQIPRFATAAHVLTLEITDAVPQPVEPAIELRAWPTTAVEQLSGLGALVAQRPLTPDEIAANFTGARRDLIARHLETLALMGEVVVDRDGRYGAARKVA